MVNFPNTFDTDNTLFIAVNNLRTTLTSSIDASTLTIPVVTTSGFPDVGFITILSDENDVTQAEAIAYNNITSTTFNATQRGAGNTPALVHSLGDNVDLTVVSAHHNELKDAVLELEHFVGVSGSENFIPVNTQTITAPTGTFTNSLTVSGVPVSVGSLTVRETDGFPFVSGVNTIVVTTGTLVNNGGGQVTILTGGGGGGGGSSISDAQIVLLSQFFS